MKKNITLVVLAAGMGSRFGGLKQIEPMGPNKEFIIDYSVYDAVKVGFNKIVFIIKEENFNIFKETIGSRVEPHVKVEYAFQKLDDIPENYKIPRERVKPLGTAHALLCLEGIVNEPFAMINADDFYGKESFEIAYNYLSNIDNDSTDYGMICYQIANTLTENGSVKRGVCQADNGYLNMVTESIVEKQHGKITAKPINGGDEFYVRDDELVNMNFLLFTPTIFNFLKDLLGEFLNDSKNDLLTSEFLIPMALDTLIKRKEIVVNVLPTNANWYGVTYRADIDSVKKAIIDLIDRGVYPFKLWD